MVSAIKPYMHRFNLSAIKAELEHRFGKNEARGVMLAWGAHKGERGITADAVAQELDAEARRAVRPDIDRNPQDIKFADPTKWRKMHGEEKSEAEDYSEYDKPITINDVQILRSIGRKSINQFTSEDIKKAQKWAYKFYKELGVKSPFFRAWFGDWRAYDKKTPVVVTDIPKSKLSNQRQNVVCDDTGWTVRISGHGERNTRAHAGGEYLSVKGLNNIVELIKNAVLFDTEIHEHHDNNAPNEMIAFDHKLYALGKDANGSVALYKITIEDIYQSNTQPDDLRFHNLRYVKEIEKVVENTSGSSDQTDQPYTAKRSFSTTTYSISDLFEFVKGIDIVNEIFSKDVASKLGVKRSTGKLSKDIKYSRKVNTLPQGYVQYHHNREAYAEH